MCPYCFETYDALEIDFVADQGPSPATPEADTEWVYESENATPAPEVEAPASVPEAASQDPGRPTGTGFLKQLRIFLGEDPERVHANADRTTTGRRAVVEGLKPWCKSCLRELPPNIEWARPVRIAVVGEVGAGKSSTIYSLIEMLRRQKIPYDLGWRSFGFATKSDGVRFEDSYSSYIDGSQLIPSTKAGTKVEQLTVTCEAQLPERDMDGYRTWNLTFFDVAGETLRGGNWAPNAQQLFVADAYLFIISVESLLLSKGIDVVPNGTGTDEEQLSLADVSSLLQQNITGIQRYLNKTDGELIEAPAAFMLTKSDLFLRAEMDGHEALEPMSNLFGRSDYQMTAENVDAMSASIVEALEGIEAFQLLTPPRSFRTPRFFLASPWGSQPIEGLVGEPDPIGLESCLMWLLSLISKSSVDDPE